MQAGMTRRGFGRTAAGVAATVGSFAILRHARGEEPLRLRCSLDTAPSHVRNVSIVDYLGKVEKETGGKIVGEVFHAGQLFADLNVAKALLQGQVDMACPGAWTQTGIVPDCDFVQLPAFYGRKIEATHAASDGKPGQIVKSQLEAKLRTHVLGNFIDLGFQNWYTTKKAVKSLEDLKGLKIRSPGGAGISWRIALAGGIPNTTAWPNVPLALSQGTFDGFVSTDESCATAKLWEAGVRYSYADHQYVGQYIPMISGGFWSKLNADQQKIMKDIWAQNIGTYRANAFASQQRARKLMEENNVTFFDPPAAQLDANRKLFQADVATLIKDAKLSPDVVKASEEAVASVS
ncbi:MAG: TRAP transporter substrate-binding protein DctP [Rhodospirillales bacterium]|nr:TRAP transporter substrate-binding protein DctP [Rhodospirillales bacterium]